MARQVQELSLGKRFAGWFRRNEKIFWIALLVLVSVSFGATFLMMQVLTDVGRDTFCTVGGTSYSWRDVSMLNNRFREVSGMSRRLDYSNLVGPSALFRGDDRRREAFRDVLVPLLSALTEADALGIEVPPERITDVAKECYTEAAGADRVREATRYLDQEQRKKFFDDKRHEELMKGVAWSPQAYRAWVRGRGYSVRDFEAAIEMLLRVEALRELFLTSDVVSRKDLYGEFARSRRKLRIAYAILPAERFVDPKERTDEELRAFYLEHGEKFVEPDRLRLSYLRVPLAHFESTVKVTDEDVRARYDMDKAEKYKTNPAAPLPLVSYPLTPEERRETEQLQDDYFVPFEEVAKGIREEIERERAEAEARSLASELRRKLAAPPAASPGQEPALPPSAREIAQGYEFVRFEETPWFSKEDAEKTLGAAYDKGAVESWFRDLASDKPLAPPPRPLGPGGEDEAGRSYFVVAEVSGEKSRALDWDSDRDLCIAKAKEELSIDDALRKATAEAESFIVELRKGTPMEEVARGFPTYVTEPMGRSDYGKMPLEGDEKVPWRVEAAVRESFFRTLDLDERVMPTPVEDVEERRIFVFAIDEVAERADPAEFTAAEEGNLREQTERMLLLDRLRTGWPGYLEELVAKHAEFAKGVNIQAG